ncbi:MAG: hypothetical protein ABJF10_18370 [Chthoniobacter sp.]|uniref:hypothetical protein n=1 Tax=Chthoniobacter sp. TaxID=2510640 RepID=UPI0032AE1394
MRLHSTLRRTILSLSVAVAGSMLLALSHGWTQTAGKAAAPTAPPADPGLFPDPEPVLVKKASLHGLLEVLLLKDGEMVGPMIWQLLATMSKAKDQGTGPSEFLAASYRAERLKGSDAAEVQNCLLSAWAGAQSLALFTPENIALMERGAAPRATRGMERGRPVNLDIENLPAVTLTTKATRKVASAATPAPAPVPEQAPVVPAVVVKTVEVRLHERVPLDAYGMRNMDFRVDSIDPHGSVSFLFDDRTVHHFGQVDRRNSVGLLTRELGFNDGVDKMTAFSPEAIPDTKIRGVKLVTLPFAAIYLDEDIGVQVNLRLIVRVASEALMIDQLPPERRKLYEIQNPP